MFSIKRHSWKESPLSALLLSSEKHGFTAVNRRQFCVLKLTDLFSDLFFALGWTGALTQYIPSLELMNRKLPFGLAETGLCYRPEEDDSDAIGW